MFTNLAANLLIDWVTPVDFDAHAHISLADTDGRLKLDQLLRWELRNLLDILDVLSRHVLLPLQSLLAQSDARDKLLRLVQYALLMVHGLVTALGGASSAARLQAIIRPLADARQTGRWLKGVTPLLALRGELGAGAGAPRLDAVPALVARLSLLGYYLLDHLVWLQKVRVLGGEAGRSSRRALRLLALVHASTLCHAALRAAQMVAIAIHPV